MKLVIALGGNALEKPGEVSNAETQLKVIEETVHYLIPLVEKGHTLIMSHGNGPQVGRIILQNETAKDITPMMPFDVCGAMSQGMIGYHLQQAFYNALKNKGIDKYAATIVTQVLVDANDSAFQNPTKPIGSFYSEEEAKKLISDKNYVMKEDSGRGYRRVVPSPIPQSIVELPMINQLIEAGQIVITVGGGGIPVIVNSEGNLVGVDAVIDKDLASQCLAENTDADDLIMLTAVDNVAINFGKPNQKNLGKITVEELEKAKADGHFAEGSMLPKVEAALRFVKAKKGRKAIITSLDKINEALEGNAGTILA